MKRAHSIFLGILFFWVPLAFFIRAADGFTLTKEIAAVLALSYFGALWCLERDWRVFQPVLVRLSLLFLLWMAVDSLAVGLLKMEVLKGSVHLFLLVGTLVAVVYVSRKGYSYEKFLHYALIAGVLMAVYGIVQAAGLDRLDWNVRFEKRAFATMGNPDYLGGHLVGLVPLAFILVLRSENRQGWLWFRMVTLILFVGLLMTRVRGAELALAATLIFLILGFLLPWGRDLFRRNLRFVLFSLGIVIGVGGAFVMRHGGWSSFKASQTTVQQRLETYKSAWEIVKDHPWTGVGLGHVGIQYPRYQFRPYLPSEYPAHPFVYTEHIHNEFLQFWVEGGLPGFLLFLGVLAAFGISVLTFLRDPGSKPRDKELLLGVAAGVIAILIQSLSNFPLQIAPTTILFGLFLAGPLAIKLSGSERQELPLTLAQKAVLGAVLLAVLSLGLHTVASSIAYRNTVGETNIADHGVYAVRYGEKLVALSPYNPKAWTAYAKALETTGRVDQALQAYQKSLDLNPNAPENFLDMARLYISKGDLERAVQSCEKALAITPNYLQILWVEAAPLYQLKRYGEAAQVFEKLAGYFPNNEEVYLNLGVCYVQMGRKQEAVAAWEKAYSLNPGDRQVDRYLKANGVGVGK